MALAGTWGQLRGFLMQCYSNLWIPAFWGTTVEMGSLPSVIPGPDRESMWARFLVVNHSGKERRTVIWEIL